MCTCEDEPDEGANFWSLLVMAVVGLFVADVYAHPLGGKHA